MCTDKGTSEQGGEIIGGDTLLLLLVTLLLPFSTPNSLYIKEVEERRGGGEKPDLEPATLSFRPLGTERMPPTM